MACVWPRVKSAEPCVRGSGLIWMSIARISSGWRPSGRFFWTAMRSRMSFFSSASNASCAFWRNSAQVSDGRVAGVLREDLLLDLLGGGLAVELVLDLRGGVERGAVRVGDLAREVLVDLRHLDLHLRLAGLLGQLALRGAQLADLRVRDVQRVEDLGLGHLVGARLDHQDGLLGARHDEVEVGLEQLLLGRVDHEVALELADPHRADRRRERDVGDLQGGRRAVHGQHVVGDDLVDGERHADELRLAAPALREQRPQRTVDHARDQRRLLAGAALALEERAGDLPGGVHALLDIHRQREEVDVAQIACGGRVEDDGVARADDDGP